MAGGLFLRTLLCHLDCFLTLEGKMLPALAYRNSQKGEVALDTVEWDQLQRVMTCVNQPERSLPCGSISSLRRGRDDCVITPTPCSEQQVLCKEHTRNPGAMLRFLFLVFQPRQVLFRIRA